jgi:hypothetical protein
VESKGETSGYYVIKSSIATLNSAVELCKDHGGFKGFAIGFEMEQPYGSNEYHYIGKNAVDLGYNTKIYVGSAYYFENHGYKVKPEYLFSLEDLIRGVHLNISAGNIRNVYKKSDAAYEYYKQLWEEKYK